MQNRGKVKHFFIICQEFFTFSFKKIADFDLLPQKLFNVMLWKDAQNGLSVRCIVDI